MSYTKVSVLVPTRRRIDFLTRMMDSYLETRGNPDWSEFVFRCDQDDIESVRFLAQYDWPIIVGPRREGYKSLPTFYNEMAGVATGDLLICGNDDMRFATPDWPQLIMEEAGRFPDGIFNIGVATGLNDDKFPFSIVSRELVRRMGLINDPRLLFSDIFLLDVTKHFGRAVRTHRVTFPHDWAGHTDDETRREANQHEFSQVFADTTGAWSDEYRERHQRVVAETVARIDPDGSLMSGNLLGAFDAWTPPAGRDELAPWPPAVAPVWPGTPGAEPTLRYDRAETAALLKAMTDAGVQRRLAMVAPLDNGMASLLWGHVFDRVVTIAERPQGGEPIEDGRHTVLFGSTGASTFMMKALDRFGAPDLLVLDYARYANLISPYFLLRRAMARPGVIVFAGSVGRPEGTDDGMQRFLAGLASGDVDGIRHDIRHIHRGGIGFAYEVVG